MQREQKEKIWHLVFQWIRFIDVLLQIPIASQEQAEQSFDHTDVKVRVVVNFVYVPPAGVSRSLREPSLWNSDCCFLSRAFLLSGCRIVICAFAFIVPILSCKAAKPEPWRVKPVLSGPPFFVRFGDRVGSGNFKETRAGPASKLFPRKLLTHLYPR